MTLKERAEMGMGLLIDNLDEPLMNRVEDIIRFTIEDCAEIAKGEFTDSNNFRTGPQSAKRIEEKIRVLIEDETMKPLNGSTTHALTEHARGKLQEIAQSPLPTAMINPGVVNRLLRGGLVEIVQLKSPYKAHRGGTCAHLRITEAGRKAI
jgi:hypothetical protein